MVRETDRCTVQSTCGKHIYLNVTKTNERGEYLFNITVQESCTNVMYSKNAKSGMATAVQMQTKYTSNGQSVACEW